MGKEGEINIIKQIKKILNMERKDKRGMKNLEQRTGQEKTTRRGFLLAGALAALTAVGCALLPGKAVEEDYQREGRHEGVAVSPVPIGGYNKLFPKEEKKWKYEIYKKNGKTYYKGDVFAGGGREHYEGEIYPGEVNEKMSKEESSERAGGERQATKLKSGEHYLTKPGFFIGEKPDGSIIKMSDCPIEVSKERSRITVEQKKKEEKEGKKSIWKIMMQNLDH